MRAFSGRKGWNGCISMLIRYKDRLNSLHWQIIKLRVRLLEPRVGAFAEILFDMNIFLKKLDCHLQKPERPLRTLGHYGGAVRAG